MTLNNILFIGLGGAGQRHLRIFHDLTKGALHYWGYRRTHKTPTLNADFSVNSGTSLSDLYGISISSDIQELFKSRPELVVISTPTSLHLEMAALALKNGSNVLVEKPLSDTLKNTAELFAMARQKGLRVVTSYQRRYNPAFAWIKQALVDKSISEILHVHFNVFSCLPQWHKYEDFKEMYAARKELGGGVLLTEIHEVDLCCWWFGLPVSVYCQSRQASSAGLDVEDTASLILEYPRFSVTLNLCFMAKVQEKNMLIKTERGDVRWEEVGNKLTVTENQKTSVHDFSQHTMNDMFLAQARDVLKSLGAFHAEDEFNGLASLSVIEAAKRSALTGKKETPPWA